MFQLMHPSHHPSALYVELYGSWDNFSEPWQMKRDSRRGWGNWTGCHRFSNVVYDGDSAGFHEKRDGGLKMGGTYWYYVSLKKISNRASSSLENSIASIGMRSTTTPHSLAPALVHFFQVNI
jgi:hypothetical protein